MHATESTYLSSDYEIKKNGKLPITHNNDAMAYIIQLMKTHRGKRIIHKGKFFYWPDGLSHMIMDYLEEKMKSDYTMYRVIFKSSQKKIIMDNNNDSTNIF